MACRGEGVGLKQLARVLGGLFLLGVAAGAPAVGLTDEEVFRNFRFNLINPGARSLALSGAFVSLADDATAAQANPSGLAFLRRWEVFGEFRSIDNGAQALEALERERFDLLLSDVVMPKMDGHELYLRVRAAYPDMPVLMNFLPLHAIVVVAGSRILPYLDDYAAIAGAMAGKPETPRNMCLITGASGTTDTEGVLVKGAHGPKFLHVVVAGEE